MIEGYVDVSPELMLDLCRPDDGRSWCVITRDAIPADAKFARAEIERDCVRIWFTSETCGGPFTPVFRRQYERMAATPVGGAA